MDKKHFDKIINFAVNSVAKGNQLIKLLVPINQEIELDILEAIGLKMPMYNMLVATEEIRKLELLTKLKSQNNLHVVNFDTLFEKKIEINGDIKINQFEILIIDRIPYGILDKYHTEREINITKTLTNRINELYRLYQVPIISISKTDKDSVFKINHFAIKQT